MVPQVPVSRDAQTAMHVDMSEWPCQGLLGRALMELRAEFAGAAGKEIEIRMVRGDITKISAVRRTNRSRH